MDKALRLRLLVCSLITFFSFWFLAPTAWDIYHADSDTPRPSWMPNTAMRLGLDLQGGMHMVLGVDLDDVVLKQLSSYGASLEKFTAEKGVPGLKTRVLPNSFELEVIVPNPADRTRVADLITQNFTALDFVGDKGDNIIVTRILARQEELVRSNALDQSIETIRNRIDEFGVSEPLLSKKGESQILVQFPGAKDPERLKNLIGQTAQLSFAIVSNAKLSEDLATSIAAAETAGAYARSTFSTLSQYRDRLNKDLAEKLPPDTQIAFQRNQDINRNDQSLTPFLLSTKHIVPGSYIESATVQMSRDPATNMENPVVSFNLNAAGTPLFAALTTEFRGSQMAIVLDGMVKSAPTIQSSITGGSGQITLGRGSFEDIQREATDLAIVLRAGALPAKVEVQEERLIGPSMGKDAIEMGKNSLLVTAILVFLFIWFYYGVVGLIADFVTLINITCIFSLLGMMGATLTLPGIAGIVLTLGMAVDSLIIIFERMREEKRLGRSPEQIIELGFDRAFSTILDSNITTAIGAFILIQFGTGPIRGFGVTLLVGILINVFMATFFTKAVMTIFSKLGASRDFSLGLPKKELQELNAK